MGRLLELTCLYLAANDDDERPRGRSLFLRRLVRCVLIDVSLVS